jgi:hypothetical protein
MIRSWLREYLSEHSSATIEEIESELTSQEWWTDEFERQLYRELIRDMRRSVVNSELRQMRREVHAEAVGRPLLYPIRKQADRLHRQWVEGSWHRWYESVGGRRVCLTEMTRAELERVAEQRERQAEGTLLRAEFLRRLAQPLGIGERVSDRWTPTEMDELYRETMAKGRDR